MKSQDIEAVSELYKSQGGLTEYEKTNLTRIPRGTCLFNPSHSVRKFVNLYYNKLEKQIAWANYINERPIFDNEEDKQEITTNKTEIEVLLPKPLKAIYMFFYNLKNKKKEK